jgi:hypothetical protein
MAAATERLITKMSWSLMLALLGFSESLRIQGYTFRDRIALFWTLLNTPHKDLPIRSFIEIITDFLAHYVTCDTVDRQ